MDYLPVSARLNDGSYKTYANGCAACSDSAVAAYTEDLVKNKSLRRIK